MEQKSEPIAPPLNPFNNIGLAFSGGGFRAAAFALGALSYLDQIQFDGRSLKERVTYSSSTSGGTIANLLFVQGLHRGDPFLKTYLHAIDALSGETLLLKALSLLNDNRKWKTDGVEKQQNMINAFARVYDEMLFDRGKVGVFWDKTHVKGFEVCVNATEFYRGLGFRFQTDGTDNKFQIIGNNYLNFDTNKLEVFKKIKLADLLASSSCFPVGFEPIVFPEDFTYKEDDSNKLTSSDLRQVVFYEDYQEVKRLLSAAADESEIGGLKPPRSFGLMDGGITDNQGLHSLIKADRKRRDRAEPNPFDIMIVTDVTSYFMKAYEMPVINNDEAEWRKQNVGAYLMRFKEMTASLSAIPIVTIIIIALMMIVLKFGCSCLRPVALIMMGGAATILILSVFIKYHKIGKALIKEGKRFDIKALFKGPFHLEKNFSDAIVDKLSKYLKITRLNVLEQMLKARLASALSMVLDVNLKQVRRLIYEMFYSDKLYENRRLPNFIYELSSHNIQSRTNRFNDPKRLGWLPTDEDKIWLLTELDEVSKIAEEARLTGTTLWFDQNDTDKELLKKNIMTGQFTTCMNLLEYVISLERKEVKFNDEVTKRLYEFKDRLIFDLNKFKNRPGWMYEEFLNRGI